MAIRRQSRISRPGGSPGQGPRLSDRTRGDRAGARAALRGARVPSLSRARGHLTFIAWSPIWCLRQDGPAPPDSELRQFLRTLLPEPMIPSAFVVLEALPLTHNGKVDREALPAPEGVSFRPDALFVAPRGPLEEEVASIWGAVLGLERVGAHDNFFDLGGHSLLATQVISRLREATGVEIPLRALFESPTVAGMAERIEAARRDDARRESIPIEPDRADRSAPLSFSQEALWFLDQLAPGSPPSTSPRPCGSRGRSTRALSSGA